MVLTRLYQQGAGIRDICQPFLIRLLYLKISGDRLFGALFRISSFICGGVFPDQSSDTSSRNAPCSASREEKVVMFMHSLVSTVTDNFTFQFYTIVRLTPIRLAISLADTCRYRAP